MVLRRSSSCSERAVRAAWHLYGTTGVPAARCLDAAAPAHELLTLCARSLRLGRLPTSCTVHTMGLAVRSPSPPAHELRSPRLRSAPHRRSSSEAPRRERERSHIPGRVRRERSQIPSRDAPRERSQPPERPTLEHGAGWADGRGRPSLPLQGMQVHRQRTVSGLLLWGGQPLRGKTGGRNTGPSAMEATRRLRWSTRHGACTTAAQSGGPTATIRHGHFGKTSQSHADELPAISGVGPRS